VFDWALALLLLQPPAVREEIVVTPAVREETLANVVTPEHIARLPLQRPSDVLELVPGVVVSQHSGEGKANQFYLRGFNLDHGTDLAQTVAGAPVNMRTHAHGQGYSDDNFVMPELIGAVQYRKGPYYADAGDFASAGTVDIDYVSALERPLVSVTGGRFGYRRLFTAGSRTVENGALLGAFELAHDDGPWLRPDAFRKLNALLRYTAGRGEDAYSVTLSAYDGRWNASDQIPSRAVQEGMSRFGEIDPSDGGTSYRASLAADWQRGGAAPTKASAYVIAYGLDLFSNFTYFLDDPVHGDQFEQQDRRVVFGGRATRQWTSSIFENLAGVELRDDHIGALGLYHTAARRRLETLRSDRLDETSAAVFAQTTARWTPKLRTVTGLRFDTYRVASIASPKLSAIYTPRDGTELYASAGLGFHSNDFRETETPLVRTRGAELGVRTAHATLAVWALDIGSELVFAGDSGTTEASGATRRSGIEWTSTVRITRHLALDANLAWSRARFRSGDRIPGAVEGVASSGVSFDFGRLTGAVRYRYFGPRPLVEDDSVRSRASQTINVESAFAVSGRLTFRVEVLNLTNARVSDVDYFYPSRLRGEPVGGVADTHTHPLEPRSLRVRIETRF
jgi:outer membrane cobalamin receptor